MSMFALEFIMDLYSFFQTCHRLLIDNGFVVLSTVHPLADFEWDNQLQGILVKDYINLPVEIWGPKDLSSTPTAKTIFRTIEKIFTTISKVGFEVKSLLEPAPLPKHLRSESPYKGPYWEPYLERFKTIPFAVVIKAAKVN